MYGDTTAFSSCDNCSFPADGRDYIDYIGTLTIPSGVVESLVDVTIVDDDVLEGQEMFTATLTTEDPNVDIPSDSDTATVIVNDDDCKLVRK